MKNGIYSKSDNSGVDSTQILGMGRKKSEHINVGIDQRSEKMRVNHHLTGMLIHRNVNTQKSNEGKENCISVIRT